MPTTKTDLSLAAKLAEVMGLMRNIPKEGFNKAQNYRFVRESDVAEKASALLAERHVFLHQNVVSHSMTELYRTQSGNTMYLTTVDVEFTWIDGESGEKMPASTFVGYGADTGDKGIYKAITGALKYALTTAFLIPNEADDPEVTRKDELEESRPAAAKPAYKPKPKNGLATEEEKADFVAAAERHGLVGDHLRAFVGIVTGGKPRNETTSADIALLIEKLGDADLVDEVLEAKVAA